MEKRLQDWHPTESEVRKIVADLRPMIHEMARRDEARMADELARRTHQHRRAS